MDTSTPKSLGSPEPNEDTSNDTSTLSPLSDFYIVSPPLCKPQTNLTPIRASLTPPPCSEKINRAIRTAEHNLDAAVENVHRYISQGCPDSDTEGAPAMRGGSPDSEYSDDLFSPQNLPDFRHVRSPMRSCSPKKSPMKTIGEEDVKQGDGMRRRIFEESDEEGSVEAEENLDESGHVHSDEADIDLDMSKLHIDTNEKTPDGESNHAVQDSDDESDESVMIVNTKTFKRRVIDDDESSVESETDFSVGDQLDEESDAETEQKEQITVGNTNKNTERIDSEAVLDDAFTGLTLDDAAEPTVHSTKDASVEDVSDSESLNITIQTINSQDSDDDDIIFTEGCGCWTMDKETKDLYLPPESGKWPKIRLPFSTYQRLFPHQRIGIQWMASLHRNAIKGGILADDMGMVRVLLLCANCLNM
jgi:SNF2 family DNA or RNA helicase